MHASLCSAWHYGIYAPVLAQQGRAHRCGKLVLRLEPQVEVLPLVRVDRGRRQHAQVGRVARQLLRRAVTGSPCTQRARMYSEGEALPLLAVHPFLPHWAINTKKHIPGLR